MYFQPNFNDCGKFAWIDHIALQVLVHYTPHQIKNDSDIFSPNFSDRDRHYMVNN